MAEKPSAGPSDRAISPADWIDTARDVVYDDDGELISPHQLGAALEEHGVEVSSTSDGIPAYRDVPRDVPLTACHLAVELREDPAVFIVGKALARYA